MAPSPLSKRHVPIHICQVKVMWAKLNQLACEAAMLVLQYHDHVPALPHFNTHKFCCYRKTQKRKALWKWCKTYLISQSRVQHKQEENVDQRMYVITNDFKQAFHREL